MDQTELAEGIIGLIEEYIDCQKENQQLKCNECLRQLLAKSSKQVDKGIKKDEP